MIATHDLDQARRWDSVLCLNRRQIAFGPPEPSARPRRCSKRPTAARSSRSRGGGRGDPAPPPSPPLTMLDAAPAKPFMQRAIVEIALLGLAGGALGCWVVLYELSYAAESLAHALFPGLVIAALAGLPLLLGGGAGDRRSRRWRSRSPRARRGIGRDIGVAVVVTTLFGARRPARALAGLAARDRDAPVRRHPRPERRRPARRGACSRSLVAGALCARCTGGCWRSASTAARARALGLAPALGRRGAAASCSPRRSWSPCRGSATCSSSPSSSARPRPRASSPTGSCR